MKDIKIMFMGTPAFAAHLLQGLIDASYNIVGLVSQPDRPVGRKQIITPTPTKEVALAHGIPVYQVEKIRNDYEFVKAVNPDLIVTCAYGQIIPQGLLDIPHYGCINVHASLLPNLRGGAPIHHALIDGYKKTGISIMEMTSKMDAGKVYMTNDTIITDDDDLESLSNRLQEMGLQSLLDFLPLYLEGLLTGKEQNEEYVTFGYNIRKEEEIIDWHKSAREVFNLIRGLSPKPAAHTTLDGEVFKIYKSRIVEEDGDYEPGLIVEDKKRLVVACSKGKLELLVVQPAGKKPMTSEQFLNGQVGKLVGKVLGV